MSAKTFTEYTQQQAEQLRKLSAAAQKRQKSFRKRLAIFAIIFVVLAVAAVIASRSAKHSVYNDLQDADVSNIEAMQALSQSGEALSHSDAYKKVENAVYGNMSMNAMNYGLMAENKYGSVFVNGNEQVILHTDTGEVDLGTEQISQINLSNDLVIYRSPDKRVYTCKYDGTEKNILLDEKVGTVFLIGEYLYYVSLNNSNNLYKYNLTDQSTVQVLNADIQNFTIVADKLLYLDYEHNLIACDLNQGTTDWKIPNVSKFYYNGSVFIQNNDKVIRFNLNGHYPKDIAEGINELLGVDKNNIYYSIDKTLYAQSSESGEKQELPYSYDYYKGVYSINGEIKALGGNIQ